MANKRKNIQELKINTINLNPPIFIVGAEKSGTTLLRKILGKHHNIYEIKAETELFRKFKPPIYSYLNKLEKNKEFETLIKTMLTFLLYKHDGAVNSLLRKEYPGNVVELYKEIINLNELA
ncbi:MAG: sulfotransferase, partial [Candidatus Melainabacteria bacterium]|nr:sulfotransferase [Candidatus Melainabacteria bacterium]